MLPELSYGALESLRIPDLVRGLRNAAPILCYHNVVPATHDPALGEASLHLREDEFERQLDWLAAHYRIVSLDELVDGLVRHRSLRGSAAITFDDAYAGVFDYAWPLLKARAIPATAFVIAGAAERPAPFWWDYPDKCHADASEREHWITDCHGDSRAVLTNGMSVPPLPEYMLPAGWATIRRAAEEGMAIGAHSMTHRALPTLTEREIQFEVAPCRSVIAQRTGVRPTAFAYPYGLFDDRVVTAVGAAHYGAAVGLDAGLNDSNSERWSLKRINVPASLPPERFGAWAAGLVPHHRHPA